MYHVKLLLKYTVKEQIFYEESILQVDAGSFDEAYQKAEIYVKQTMDNKRRNMYGDTVHCTVVDYLALFFSLMTWKVMYRKCIPESFRIIRSFPKRNW